MAHSWRTGEVITATKLNDMEERIDANTYHVFSQANDGLVPRPTGTPESRFLREDGTWMTPSYDSLTRAILFNPAEYPEGDGYSEERDYSIGNYVIYENQLYVCNTDCEADTWENNNENFTLTTIVAELNAIRGLF